MEVMNQKVMTQKEDIGISYRGWEVVNQKESESDDSERGHRYILPRIEVMNQKVMTQKEDIGISYRGWK